MELAVAATLRQSWKDWIKAVLSLRMFRRFVIWRIAGSGPKVAITFDDGPSETWTPLVLDILAQHNARATFFLLADHVQAFPDIVRRMLVEGHEIGNHGYNHKRHDSRFQSVSGHRVLQEFGVTTNYYRPPGGAFDVWELFWLIKRGFTTVLWSLDTVDSLREEGKWKGAPPDYETVRAGEVILMHDDNPTCIRELPQLLDCISRKGLAPVTLTQLIA